MLLLFAYIDVMAVKFFSPAESWLVNSNFPAYHPYARIHGRGIIGRELEERKGEGEKE